MTLPTAEADIETRNNILPFEMETFEYLKHRYEVLSIPLSRGESQLPEEGDLSRVADKLRKFLRGQLDGDTDELEKYQRLGEAATLLQEKYIPIEKKLEFSQLSAEEKLKGAIVLESIMKQSLSSEVMKKRFDAKSEPEKLNFLLTLAKREDFKQYTNVLNLAITGKNEEVVKEYGFENLDEAIEFQLQTHESITDDQLLDLIEERKQYYLEEGLPDRVAETTAKKAIEKAHMGLKLFDRLYKNSSQYRQMLRELGLIEEKKVYRDAEELEDTVSSIKLLAA